MNPTEMIVDLLRQRPAGDATPEARAAWYRQKAATFDAIAAESDDLYRVVEAREMAHNARCRALEVLGVVS